MPVCQAVPEISEVRIPASRWTGVRRSLRLAIVVMSLGLGACLQDMEPSPGLPDGGVSLDAATNVDAQGGSDANPATPDAGIPDDGGMDDGGMDGGGMDGGGMDGGGMDAGPIDAIQL